MPICVLCKKVRDTDSIRSNPFTYELNCSDCLSNYRQRLLPIYQSHQKVSLIPFDGAVRYKIVRFVPPSSNSRYCSPILIQDPVGNQETPNTSSTSTASSAPPEVEVLRSRSDNLFSPPQDLLLSPPQPPPANPLHVSSRSATPPTMGSTVEKTLVKNVTSVKRFLDRKIEEEIAIKVDLSAKLQDSKKNSSVFKSLNIVSKRKISR